MKRKWFLRILLLGLLLVGTYLFLISSTGMDWIRQKVESQVNRRIQGQLSLGRLRGNLFTRLRIEELSLRPKGEAAQEILHVEHLELEYRLLPLIRRAAIRRLSVHRPTFVLEIDETGATNLDRLLLRPDALLAFLQRFAIAVPDSLWLRDGVFTLIDRQRDLDCTFRSIQLHTRRPPKADWGTGSIDIQTISLASNAFTDTALSLSGTFQINSDSLRVTDLSLSSAYAQMNATGAASLPYASTFQWLSTLNADLSRLQPHVPSLPTMAGQAALRVMITDSPAHPKIQAEVTLTDARFPWGDVPAMQANLTLADSVLTLTKLGGQMNGSPFQIEGRWGFSGPEPEYRAKVLLEKMNLSPLLGYFLPEQNVAGLLDMDVELQGQGIQNPIVSARGNMGLTDFQMGRVRIGDLHLKGTYLNERVALSGSIETIVWDASGLWRTDGLVDLQFNAHTSDLAPLARLLRMQAQGEAALAARVHGHLPQVQLAADMQAQSLSIGAFQFEDLLASLNIDSAAVAKLDLQLNDSDIRLTGRLDAKQRRLQAVHLVIDSLDVADRIIPSDRLGIGGLLTGALDAEGPLEDLRMEGHLRLSGAQWKGQAWGDFDGHFSFVDSLLNGQVISADSALSAQADIFLAPNPCFDAALCLNDFSLEPLLLSAGIPYVKGKASMYVQGSGPFEELTKIQGYATLEPFTLMIHGKPLHTPYKTQITLEAGRLFIDTWDLVSEHTRLSMAGGLSLVGEQQFQLDLDPLRLDIFGLATSRGDTLSGMLQGTVFVNGTAESPRVQGQLQLTDLNVPGMHEDTVSVHLVYAEREARMSALWQQSGSGRLAGEITLPWHLSLDLSSGAAVRGPMQMDASAQRFRLSWLKTLLPHASEHLDGIIDGKIALSGDPKNWKTWSGILSVDSLTVTEAEEGLVNLEPIQVELDHGSIKLASLAMGAYSTPQRDNKAPRHKAPTREEPKLILEGTLSFTGVSDLSVVAHHLEAQLPAAFIGLEDQIRGRLYMDLTWYGIPGHPQIKGTWRMIDGRFHPLAFSRFEGALTYADQQMDLDNVELALGNQTLYLDGTIPMDLRLSRAPKSNLPGAFHLTAHAPWLDLSQLTIDTPELTSLKGSLYLDARIEGSLKHPRGVAEVKATNVEAKLRSLDDAFSFDQIALYADSAMVAIATDGGRFGRGELNLSGAVSLEPQRWGEFSVELYGNGVPIRVPRTIDLTANTYLNWEGRPQASKCSGYIEVLEGVFRRPMNWAAFSPFRERIERPAEMPGRWLKDIELDIALSTKHPFQIRPGGMDVPLHISMHVGGTAARPVVLGDIQADKGSYIHYIGRRFLVDHLALQSTSPYRFDPELSLQAHTELLDIEDVTPYTITLNVIGPISKPEVRLSSTPSLGELDILSLLTLGTTQQMFLDKSEAPSMLVKDRARDLAIQRAMGLTSEQFSHVLGTYGVNVNAHVSDVSKWTDARISLDKQLTQRTVIIYSTSVGGSANQRVEVDYKLTDHLSLETETDQDGDAGIDLRFKYRF